MGSIQSISYNIFIVEVFSRHRKEIKRIILDCIDRERQGEATDKEAIKNAINV